MERRLPAAARKDVLNSLTKQMALETADMEARLASLRSAMAKEKAKREAALAHANPAGNFWSNGNAGSLRIKGGPGAQQRQPATALGTQQQKPKLPGQQGSFDGGGTRSINTTAASSGTCSTAAVTRNAGQFSKHNLCPGIGLMAASAKTPSIYPAVHSTMPDPSFKAAKADQPMTDKDQPLTNKDCIPNDIQQSYPISFSASSRQPGNKQDVQPRDNESLLCGTYNEADSRNSFLEALNEWRRAGASSSHDKPGQAAQATSTAGTSGGTFSATTMVVQTDDTTSLSMRSSSTAAAAGSGSRNSTAGVSGPYFMKIWAQRSLKPTVGAASTVVDEDSAAIQGSHHHDLQEAPELVEQSKQQLSSNVGTAEPDSGYTEQLQELQFEICDSPTDCDKKTDSLAAADYGNSSEGQPLGFDAWLQAAGQCAADADTTASLKPDDLSAAGTSRPHQSGSTQSAPTIAQYHMQLQLVLENLEKLEAKSLQQRDVCVIAQPAGEQVQMQRVLAQLQEGVGSNHRNGFAGFTASMRLPDAVVLPENV